jgi:hypothetical protein
MIKSPGSPRSAAPAGSEQPCGVVMAAMENTPIEVKVRVGFGGSQIPLQIVPTRDGLIQQLQGLSEQCLQINLKEFTHVCVIGEKTIWPC